MSWYEAAAYAKFAGKSLPTVVHWGRAATVRNSGVIVPASNFSGQGTRPVGSSADLSGFGTYDMAGNVREWCLNAEGDERFILGGGWNDRPTLQRRLHPATVRPVGSQRHPARDVPSGDPQPRRRARQPLRALSATS